MTAAITPTPSPTDRIRTALPVRTTGWGTALPDRVVTNAELEDRLETDDVWITDRTGIRERHVAGLGETTAVLATAAGRRALDRAGVMAGDVDLVLVATSTADQALPATAAEVSRALGTPGAACDIDAACAGFAHALHLGMAATAVPGTRTVLVIGADRMTSVTDPDDRTTAVLFGDGAGAVLLQADERADRRGPGLVASVLGGDGAGRSHLEVPVGERYLRMDGQEVFRGAIRALVDSGRAVLQAAGATPDDVGCYVPHQANRRIIDAAAARIGINEDRVVITVDRHGNTSAASIPLALAEAAETGRVAEGDLVLLAGVGAGLAWGSLLVRWGTR